MVQASVCRDDKGPYPPSVAPALALASIGHSCSKRCKAMGAPAVDSANIDWPASHRSGSRDHDVHASLDDLATRLDRVEVCHGDLCVGIEAGIAEVLCQASHHTVVQARLPARSALIQVPAAHAEPGIAMLALAGPTSSAEPASLVRL